MKMSDVFGNNIYDDAAFRLMSGLMLTGDKAEAAKHAIVNHDRLTERVKVLESYFTDLLEYSKGHQKVLDVANEAVRVCNKALKAGE